MNIFNTANLGMMINNMNLYNRNINESQSALSSGKKNVTDNIGNLGRISRLNSQISSSSAIKQNIQDGMSYLQVKSSAMDTMQSVGQRLRELSVQYNNGTLSNDDKSNMETEATSLMNQMFNIKSGTKFNGKNVFDTNDLTIQTSDNGSWTVTIKPGDMNLTQNSNGLYNYVDTYSGTTLQISLTDLLANTSMIDSTILNPLSNSSSYIGVKMNELEDTSNLQDVMEGIQTDTLSNLEDTDIASETMNMSKNSLLLNATQSLFSQSLNLNSNFVLNLLKS